jgi:hypothetical protein
MSGASFLPLSTNDIFKNIRKTSRMGEKGKKDRRGKKGKKERRGKKE